jgi:hypothetical protein
MKKENSKNSRVLSLANKMQLLTMSITIYTNFELHPTYEKLDIYFRRKKLSNYLTRGYLEK